MNHVVVFLVPGTTKRIKVNDFIVFVYCWEKTNGSNLCSYCLGCWNQKIIEVNNVIDLFCFWDQQTHQSKWFSCFFDGGIMISLTVFCFGNKKLLKVRFLFFGTKHT